MEKIITSTPTKKIGKKRSQKIIKKETQDIGNTQEQYLDDNIINNIDYKTFDIKTFNINEYINEENIIINNLHINREKFNHVKNINEGINLMFSANIDIQRITPSNIQIYKNKCMIEDCNKQIIYELSYDTNKKYICWYHLNNMIINY
jgi:hypothetical protein